MATYRGSDGSVTVSASSVAELQSWELDTERPFLDDTAMGDAAETGTLDIPAGGGRLVMRLDYDDTAQAALVDMLVAGTVPTALAAEFRLSAAKKFTSSILPTRAVIRAQRGQLVDMDVTYKVTGGVTVSWS